MEVGTMYDKLDTDVLVIGSGGAGLRAAIEAAKSGCKTTIITKGKINRSGATLLAGANISADIECDGNSLYNMGFPTAGEDDSKEKWFEEIINQGFFLNNQKMVETYVENAPSRVKELIDWGLEVNGLESERGISVSSKGILDALMNKVSEYNIEQRSDMCVVDLLVNGRVNGILAVNVFTGDYVICKAKAVIIATGGWHSLYPFNAGGLDLSGDGQGMAYRAGAELMNMEMVTFVPSCILTPYIYRGSIFPYILHTMGYGHLLNKKGEQFVYDYFDSNMIELALHTEWNKLLLSNAEFKEIKRAACLNGGVYFSMKHCPNNLFDAIKEEIPGLKYPIYSRLLQKMKEGYAIEVAPAAEYFEGGIKINENGETSVPGLYAAGECTSGLFGANRVSAATTEMLVQGAIAGEHAGKYVKQSEPTQVDKEYVEELQMFLDAPFHRKTGTNPILFRKEIQRLAEENLSAVRTQKGLEFVIKRIGELRGKMLADISMSSKSRIYNMQWMEFIELRNLLDVLEISSRSAMMRSESRGVHFREDYPYTDNDKWLKTIVFKNESGTPKPHLEILVTTKIMPPSGCTEYKAFIRSICEKFRREEL